MSDKRTCQQFCQMLSDYLDGSVELTDCRLIEEHLDACPPCAMFYESLKTTVFVCGKGLSEDMPPEVRSRLRQFLREHCRKEDP